MKRIALVACALLLGSCQSLPEDDFDAAQVLLARGDLLRTIVRLDCVPPSDSRYPRSRTIAQAIERRVRLGQRLLTRGMQLRAEWRDVEAVECFTQALEIWPELEAAAEMRAATLRRIASLDAEFGEDTSTGEVVETAPIALPGRPLVEVGDGADADAGRDGEYSHTDLASRLVEIERLLDDGLLEAALDVAESGPDLPSNPVRHRLVSVLHQRALVHYGKGALELALNDWVRLLRIDPNHAQAIEFSAAARAELASG